MVRTAYPRWLAAGERARRERARAGHRGRLEAIGIPMAPVHRAMHDRRTGVRSRPALAGEQHLTGGWVPGVQVTPQCAGGSAAAAVSRPRKVPAWRAETGTCPAVTITASTQPILQTCVMSSHHLCTVVSLKHIHAMDMSGALPPRRGLSACLGAAWHPRDSPCRKLHARPRIILYIHA
jgi:hypothetical protein